MMKLNTILLTACVFSLAACGGSERETEFRPLSRISPAPESSYAVTDDGALDLSAAASSSNASSTDSVPQRAGRFLAYTHNRTISVPTDRLRDLLETHMTQCEDAGPENCLVTNSNVRGLETNYASGNLALKASPDWAIPFLEGLPESLGEFNSSVYASSTSTVDLTAQIIDTDARLAAQTTLRDRLQQLLESREGDLGELLSVERELARVQSELDSYESQLANLRQRVSMSDINLSYEARVSPTSQSVWRPVTEAFGDFFRNVAFALSSIVTILAFVLPWLPVIVGLIWLFMFLFRKAFRKKKTPEAPATTEKGDA